MSDDNQNNDGVPRKFENRFASDKEVDEEKASGGTSSIGEVVDREERKRLEAEKKKEAEEKKRLEAEKKGAKKKKKGLRDKKGEKKSLSFADKRKNAQPQDELDLALKKGRMAGVKKSQKKKFMFLGGSVAAVLFVYMIYSSMNSYPMAGKAFSICRTYIELKVRYPKDLDFMAMSKYGKSLRIWYTRIDAFGSRRLEQMRCFLDYNKETGQLYITQVTFDRRGEPESSIESFNKVLPFILADMPLYERPRFKSNKDLSNIKVDRTAARARNIK